MMTPLQASVKRVVDLVASLVLIVILSPVLMLIALAIRLDSPGPAVFRQKRLGKDAVPFICHKFRTMFGGAPDVRNLDGSTFNAEDDPRVTPVGRFLRRTSLDELPQLINVFRGDMSLVGPRPDVADALSLYKENDWKRLKVKPGMTGWAAIHGRNRVPLNERRALDIEYVERFSLLLDLEILGRTIPYVLRGKGVYVSEQAEDRSGHVRG